jgi:formyl-CoA transferase
MGAMGALVALHARKLTGRGQIVDVAIYEAVLSMMESLIPEWQVAGYQRERTGALLPNVAPSNAYPTADGESILIAANQDSIFRRLADAMGEPELMLDPRYSTHSARGANQKALDDHISLWTAQHAGDVLLETLHEAGVAAGKIYTAADMLADEHFAARNAITWFDHQVLGRIAMQDVFPRLSETPGSVRWLGPELGQDNKEIYQGLLGMNEEALQGLTEAGAI